MSAYYAIFFDVKNPMNIHNSKYQRVTREKWANLSDGLPGKSVLLFHENKPVEYGIISTTTFYIVEQSETKYFVICNCFIQVCDC